MANAYRYNQTYIYIYIYTKYLQIYQTYTDTYQIYTDAYPNHNPVPNAGIQKASFKQSMKPHRESPLSHLEP